MNFFKSISLEPSNPDNHETLRDALRQNKVVVVRPQAPAKTDMGSFYYELASEIGVVYLSEENSEDESFSLNTWHQVRYIPGQENKSYKHSNRSQPLHTDYCALPVKPEISFLYCVRAADVGGATVFIDNETVITLLRIYFPELYGNVLTTKLLFRTDIGQPVPSSLVECLGNKVRINWNYYRVIAEDIKTKETVEGFRMFLDEYVFRCGVLTKVKLQLGEAVFFHDNLVLHGRLSFLGERWLNKGALKLLGT